MNKKQVDSVLEIHEVEQIEKIVSKFESLRPKSYSIFISLVVMMVIIYLAQYQMGNEFYEGGYHLFIYAIFFAGMVTQGESIRINKRIDLLAKLVDMKINNNSDK